MKRTRINLQKHRSMATLAAIVVGIFVFISPGIVFAQEFQGSESCKGQGCHDKEYGEWKSSGHPYKLMKSEEARNRPIPLPIGIDWDDVSYVIGGYKWKSRYVDTEGYIITTTFDESGAPRCRVSTSGTCWRAIGMIIMPVKRTNPTIADPVTPQTG